MDGTVTPYSSKEITSNLNIADSTLRKWCLALEEQDYNFIRTDQNKRMFSENDLFILNQFKYLVQNKNMSINNAATIVSSKYKDGSFSNETEVEQVFSAPLPNQTVEELKTEMEQLKDMNRMLLTRLDEQHRYIEERLNRMDERSEQRDKMLMDSLRQSQETKQLLLEVKEAQEKKPQRKGLFRFFSKDL